MGSGEKGRRPAATKKGADKEKSATSQRAPTESGPSSQNWRREQPNTTVNAAPQGNGPAFAPNTQLPGNLSAANFPSLSSTLPPRQQPSIPALGEIGRQAAMGTFQHPQSQAGRVSNAGGRGGVTNFLKSQNSRANEASPGVISGPSMLQRGGVNRNRGPHESNSGSRGRRRGFYSSSSRNLAGPSFNPVASDMVNYQDLIAEHFNGKRKGGDIPHTEGAKFKGWAMNKKDAMLYTLPTQGSNSTAKAYGSPTLLPGMCVSYDLFSQNPVVKVHIETGKDASHLPINTEMMEMSPADGHDTITRCKISVDGLNEETLARLLKDKLGVEVPSLLLPGMIAFGNQPSDQNSKGLDCFTIALKSRLLLKRGSSKTPPPVVQDLINEAAQSVRILVVRNLYYPFQHLDKYFDARVLGCRLHGIYNSHRDHANKELGTKFSDFIGKDSTAKLTHQVWMGSLKDNDAYASHPAKKWFTSMHELEIALSVTLIHDRDAQKMIINRVYNRDRLHRVTPINTGRNNYWVFHVETMKFDEEKHLPMLTAGTLMSVQKRRGAAQNQVSGPTVALTERTKAPTDTMASTPGASTPAASSTELDGDVQMVDSSVDISQEILPWHKCRVIDSHTSADFVVGLTLPADAADHWTDKHPEMVSFTVEFNSTSIDRQLQAVAGLTTLSPSSNLAKILLQRDFRPATLTQEPSLNEIYSGMLTETVKTALSPMIRNLFETKYGTSLVQGPPGTGKSTTNAYVCVKAAAMDIKVSATAPANVPTRSLAQAIAMEMESYREQLGVAMDCDRSSLPKLPFKMVFVPTRARAGRDLIDSLNTAYEEKSDADAILKEYQLRYHLVQLAERKALNGDDAARDWVATKNRMMEGKKLEHKDLQSWKKVALDWAPEVFRDPSVKIVVSTCNNHANDVLAYWEPVLNIIDEAAFAIEADILIPINKGKKSCKHVMLVGDHKQLSPVVPSRGLQEYCNQLDLSFFKRILDQSELPFVMLKENYRMHPEIADFPATIEYGGLLCANNTLNESVPIFRAWKAFWDGFRQLEGSRRKMEKVYDGTSRGIRRLFFNTSGHSAPRPGGSSIQNFANINWIVDLLGAFTTFLKSPDNEFEMEAEALVIQVPYTAEKNELITQMYRRLPQDVASWPVIKTVDSNQGGQSALSWLSLSPANSHHGSQIGFLDDWHRMNVALTRAQQSVAMFGNIDAWLAEFEIFAGIAKLKPWAFFLVDLLNKGSVIDLEKIPIPNKEMWKTHLPHTRKEAFGGARGWSIEQAPSPLKELLKQYSHLLIPKDKDYEEKRLNKMLEVLRELQALREAAAANVETARRFRAEVSGDMDMVVEQPKEIESTFGDPFNNVF